MVRKKDGATEEAAAAPERTTADDPEPVDGETAEPRAVDAPEHGAEPETGDGTGQGTAPQTPGSPAPPVDAGAVPEAVVPEATGAVPEAVVPEATGVVPEAVVPEAVVPATPPPVDPPPVDPHGQQPADPEHPAPGRSVLRKVAAGVLVLILAAAAFYVGGQWALADTVPRDTTVLGVPIGGLSAQEATAELTERLPGVIGDSVAVSLHDQQTTLPIEAAGLAVDPEATVAELTGFGMEPARLWRHLAGGGEQEPVVDIDRQALAAAVAELDAALQVPAVDGTITISDGRAFATAAEDGVQIDHDAAVELLATSWLTAAQPIELPSVPLPPAITQQVVDAAMVEIAEPLLSGPVVVEVADQRAELPVDVLADAASIVADGSELTLTMDGELLAPAVIDRTADLLTESADARFEFVDGAPQIVAGEPGTTLDPVALGEVVAEAALSAERVAAVDLVQSDPAQTIAELEQLGVVQKISEFSTTLTNDAVRTQNLRVGASRIDGYLLRPGETFDLISALEPITAEGGFGNAGVVVDGVMTEGMGGGLSQMATTVYNAAFFAGLEDVEHRPHSYWFSRYPEGREATIFKGSIDLKFANNTPYGVLLQSWVANGRVYVAIWSTPYWEVQTTTSQRSDVVQPTTVYSTAANCVAQAAGNAGFLVTVSRTLLLDGEVQSTESNSWRYRAQNAVVCGEPPG